MSTQHTPLPWEAVEATEHHGPYITTAFGTTVCDLYAMTDPNNIFNGGKSVPVSFTDADKNVHLIVRAVNSHNDMLAALKEIAEGKGAFSRDPLRHAANCIEEMKGLARAAIAKAEGKP